MYAGHRSDRKQVPSELIPGPGSSPGFDVIFNVSTRQPWFTFAHLLGPHLTRSCPAFSSTLTTMALDHSSLRWFEASPCRAASKGLPSSFVQLRTIAGSLELLCCARGATSRHYLCHLCGGARTPTTSCPSAALAHFFADDGGLTLGETRSAHETIPARRLPQGGNLSRLQSFDHLRAPPLARPPDRSHRSQKDRAAGPFTPRLAWAVAWSRMWYRYVPDMGNWHGWTSTS